MMNSMMMCWRWFDGGADGRAAVRLASRSTSAEDPTSYKLDVDACCTCYSAWSCSSIMGKMICTIWLVVVSLQVYSHIAGHVSSSPSDDSSSIAEANVAMCLYSLAYVLGFTIASYLIGESFFVLVSVCCRYANASPEATCGLHKQLHIFYVTQCMQRIQCTVPFQKRVRQACTLLDGNSAGRHVLQTCK